MTVPTTQDYSQSGLASLLANAVDATQLHQILNLDNLGAVAETDTGGPYSPLPDVQDTNNNDPSLLLLDNSGNTINLNDFPNLDTVILAGNNSSLHFAGLGNEVTVYSHGTGNTVDGQACGTNNIEINLGNGSHDTVFGSL